MRCPVCNHEIQAQPSKIIKSPPLDIVGNDIFLWDQVYLSDSDDNDTEAYVVEILSEVSIRVLIPTGREQLILEVWDIPADSAHKLHNPKIRYGNFI